MGWGILVAPFDWHIPGFPRDPVPVDAIPEDASPAGVIGMLGNVSEWTETVVDHPDIPDRRVRVLCGGSFSTETGRLVLTGRSIPESDEDRRMIFGFRTAGSP